MPAAGARERHEGGHGTSWPQACIASPAALNVLRSARTATASRSARTATDGPRAPIRASRPVPDTGSSQVRGRPDSIRVPARRCPRGRAWRRWQLHASPARARSRSSSSARSSKRRIAAHLSARSSPAVLLILRALEAQIAQASGGSHPTHRVPLQRCHARAGAAARPTPKPPPGVLTSPGSRSGRVCRGRPSPPLKTRVAARRQRQVRVAPHRPPVLQGSCSAPGRRRPSESREGIRNSSLAIALGQADRARRSAVRRDLAGIHRALMR